MPNTQITSPDLAGAVDRLSLQAVDARDGGVETAAIHGVPVCCGTVCACFADE
jgi:hypothetical protein